MTKIDKQPSPWPRRLAWALCLLTFPLIGVGGLITTTDAGMAVPDWPGTYGYNMFVYPWRTWVFGPWDLFIEHGHRLLASLVGIVTIALVVVTWQTRSPLSLRLLAIAALGLVVFQGVLGGLRVVANERLLAMAHGVTGPLFFALTCLIVARATRSAARTPIDLSTAWTGLVAMVTAVLVFTQLGLGASLRHIPETAGPWTFATLTHLHLIGAGVVTLSVLWLAWRGLRIPPRLHGARLAAVSAGVVIFAQLAAGVAAWWLKYGAPGWADSLAPATIGPNVAGGWWQTYLVTAHQLGGSLLLGLCVFVASRAFTTRIAGGRSTSVPGSSTRRPQPPIRPATPIA